MSNLITYEDGHPFPGVIGRTSDESTPAWPTPPRAPEGAPNVVMFVLDDVGFGQLSSFVGLVETPVLDRFADNGLVGAIDMPHTVPNIFSTEGLTCGHDGGSRVAPDDYQDDFAFTGTLKRVTFDLSGDLIVDTDTDMKVAMARQ